MALRYIALIEPDRQYRSTLQLMLSLDGLNEANGDKIITCQKATSMYNRALKGNPNLIIVDYRSFCNYSARKRVDQIERFSNEFGVDGNNIILTYFPDDIKKQTRRRIKNMGFHLCEKPHLIGIDEFWSNDFF